MTLGNSKPRNWGKDSQNAAINLLLAERKVVFRVKKDVLYLAPSDGINTLDYRSVATLVNVRRGRWESYNVFDGVVIADGCSRLDCIRKTINILWK